MNRRTLLGVVGAGGVAMTAGCASLLAPEPARTEGERRLAFDDETVGSGAHDAAAFEKYVVSTHDTYGEMGVYGNAGVDPGADVPFGGAWTQRLDHGDGVKSDHALILHRLPDAADGTATAGLWFWSALDPTPTDGATVEHLETVVDLPDGGASMGIYDPGGEYHSDRVDAYAVKTPRLDVRGVSASIPLPAGEVSVDPGPTQVGDAGGFAPLWRGSHEGTVGLLATCTIEWPPAAAQHLTWSVAAETTGL